MVAADGETGRGSDKQTVFYVMYGKRRKERPNVGGVSVRGVGTVVND